MDVLSIVSNVQQVPPEELISSQEQSNSSNRYDFVGIAAKLFAFISTVCAVLPVKN